MSKRVTLDDFNSISDSEDPRLALRALADVVPRKVRWLVDGLMPLRTLTLVAGVGGLGKSTYLSAVAAKLSRGELLDRKPADTILISFEDPAAEILRPRIEAADGDLQRVHEVVVNGLDGIDPVRLPHDLDELERLILSVKARLVVIDPLVAAIDTQLDAHKDQHVRSVLARLAALAEKTDAALALVGHLNKAPSTDAYLRIGGSTAFYNASRSVVLVTADSDDPASLRLLSQQKTNWSRTHAVERHRIEEVVLPGTVDPESGDPLVTSRMVFIEHADDVAGADVLSPPASGENKKLSEAIHFLLSEFADGERHESAVIKERAKDEGISERTLQRARETLAVEPEREGFPSVTYWRLPSRATPRPIERGTTGTTDAKPHSYEQTRLPDPPVVPLVPTGIGVGTNGGQAIAGDETYPDFIDACFQRGCITEKEWLEQRKLHAAAVRGA